MNHLSPDELQTLMADYKSWMNELGDQYKGGQRLEESGALLNGKNDEILTDGPFLESKEIIAGFFVIAAEDQTEANRIAQSSPHVDLYQFEVRPISSPKMK